jgi:hypothetical protein
MLLVRSATLFDDLGAERTRCRSRWLRWRFILSSDMVVPTHFFPPRSEISVPKGDG